MKTFWNALGRSLARVAVWTGRGALWASQHPQVVATVASLAGHPEVAAVINAGATAVSTAKPKV